MADRERIILQGTEARVTGGDGASVETSLDNFVGAVEQASVRGLDAEALADNVKWKVTSGPLTVCIIEQKPQLRRFKWIEANSPAPLGPQAKYKDRRLATPYVVLKVPFLRGAIVPRVELFYRNEPLRRLDDALCWSNLLNVSPNAYNCVAWVCTQYLAHEKAAPGTTGALDALMHHVLGLGGWNLSSELHEGKSAWSKAKEDGIDKRVTDVDRWEAESVRDPRFVLKVKWKPVGLTVGQLLEKELGLHGTARKLNTTAELVNVLLAGNGRKGGA
jgi:hypothetical protein